MISGYIGVSTYIRQYRAKTLADANCRIMRDEQNVTSAEQAGAGAARPFVPLGGRACTTLLRSVSIFLRSGRKASASANRQPCDESAKRETQRGRKRMTETTGTRNSAYIKKVIDTLKRRTKFSRAELESLCKFHQKLVSASSRQQVGPPVTIGRGSRATKTTEGIDRATFRDLLHDTFNVITEDTIVERMFCCWDRESEGAIRLEPWIVGLDVFLRGTLHQRIEFCFRVYDLNNDGYIAKDEVFQLFKNCLIKQPGEEDPDEGVKDLTELALKKLDVDRDGKISFRDYETAVKEEPLLLEVFGECLPTEENCAAFLKTLRN